MHTTTNPSTEPAINPSNHTYDPYDPTTHINATPTPPITTFPPDQLNEILGTLLKTDLPTDEILAKLGVGLQTFANWLHQSQAINIFTALAQVEGLRLQRRLAESMTKAVTALETVITTDIKSPRHAETVRKAASTLARLYTAHNKQPATCRNNPDTTADVSTKAKPQAKAHINTREPTPATAPINPTPAQSVNRPNAQHPAPTASPTRLESPELAATLISSADTDPTTWNNWPQFQDLTELSWYPHSYDINMSPYLRS